MPGTAKHNVFRAESLRGNSRGQSDKSEGLGAPPTVQGLRVSRTLKGFHFTLALLTTIIAASIARADNLSDQVAKANTLLQDGKAKEALDAYTIALDTAGPTAPPELLFNRACALQATNQIAEAEAAFRSAMSRTTDDFLRAAAAYNLGLIESKRAEAQAEQSTQESIDSLRRAERLFRTAAAANPADTAAAKNIDLIQRRIAAAQEKQRQEKEDQKNKDQSKKDSKDQKQDKSQKGEKNDKGDKSQQGNEDQQQDKGDENLSDDLNNLAQQQEDAGKQSQDLSKQAQDAKPDDQSKQDQLKQDQNKAAQKQNDLRNKTEQAKKQAESQSNGAQDQQQKDALDQAKDKLDKAQKAQQQAEDKLKQGDTKSAEELQKEAAKQLRDAAQQAQKAEAAKQQQEQQQKQAQQQQEGDQGQQQGQPFDVTAAQILDQERKTKEALARMQRQRSRPAPVPKDW